MTTVNLGKMCFNFSEMLLLKCNENFGAFLITPNKINTEAATRGVLCKKVLLETLKNSQENTCARVSFLIKLQASSLQFY